MSRNVEQGGVVRRGLLAVCAGLAVLAVAPRTAQAQVRVEADECRCVDRDGNEIENCTCIRAPRVVMGELAFASAFRRRAQIGVWVEAGAQGAHVTRVQDGGPADDAGIEDGDEVVAVNGHDLRDPLDDDEAEGTLDEDESLPVQRFVHLVGQLEPEEEATLVVLRDGERRTLTVTPVPAGPNVMVFGGPGGGEMAFDVRGMQEMEERARRMADESLRSWEFRGDEPTVWRFEEQPGARFRVYSDSAGEHTFGLLRSDPCMALRAEGGPGRALLWSDNCIDGVEMVELNEDLGSYFDASEGVLITEVAEESSLGLRPGDVLQAVDGREIQDPAHARRILESYRPDEEIRLRVVRQGREIEVLGRRPGD